MKHLKLYEHYSNIKSRKSNGFLIITIDNIKYKSWLWNSFVIEKEFKENLLKKNLWVGEVEYEDNGHSMNKSFKVDDSDNIGPYYKGDRYLDIKANRDKLIKAVKSIHYDNREKSIEWVPDDE